MAGQGAPTSPKAWLFTVAARRLANRLRSDGARRRREQTQAALLPTSPPYPAPSGDNTLTLLFRGCHPALSPSAQASGAVPPLQRGPHRDVGAGARAAEPHRRGGPTGPRSAPPRPRRRRGRRPARAHAARRRTASCPLRPRRRPRAARRARPHALGPPSHRRGGRPRHRVTRPQALGPYPLQAAIAAVHDEAPAAQDTDWPQILALYRLLERMVPNPTVTLNRAVAEAMVHGPRAADLLATLTVDNRVSGAHRLDAVRAHSPRDGRRALRRLRLLPAP